MNKSEPPTHEPRHFIEETLDEHRECMRVVAEVEKCLDQQPDRAGRWLDRLRDSLPMLAATLREHFRSEQEGPLYRTLPIQAPRFAHRLEKLEAEHVRILETVDNTVARAKNLRDPQMYEMRELNAQVQLIVATIRRHEAEENEIVIEAHWDEVGVGD